MKKIRVIGQIAHLMAVDTAVRCTAGRINLNLTQHEDNYRVFFLTAPSPLKC